MPPPKIPPKTANLTSTMANEASSSSSNTSAQTSKPINHKRLLEDAETPATKKNKVGGGGGGETHEGNIQLYTTMLQTWESITKQQEKDLEEEERLELELDDATSAYAKGLTTDLKKARDVCQRDVDEFALEMKRRDKEVDTLFEKLRDINESLPKVGIRPPGPVHRGNVEMMIWIYIHAHPQKADNTADVQEAETTIISDGEEENEAHKSSLEAGGADIVEDCGQNDESSQPGHQDDESAETIVISDDDDGDDESDHGDDDELEQIKKAVIDYVSKCHGAEEATKVREQKKAFLKQKKTLITEAHNDKQKKRLLKSREKQLKKAQQELEDADVLEDEKLKAVSELWPQIKEINDRIPRPLIQKAIDEDDVIRNIEHYINGQSRESFVAIPTQLSPQDTTNDSPELKKNVVYLQTPKGSLTDSTSPDLLVRVTDTGYKLRASCPKYTGHVFQKIFDEKQIKGLREHLSLLPKKMPDHQLAHIVNKYEVLIYSDNPLVPKHEEYDDRSETPLIDISTKILPPVEEWAEVMMGWTLMGLRVIAVRRDHRGYFLTIGQPMDKGRNEDDRVGHMGCTELFYKELKKQTFHGFSLAGTVFHPGKKATIQTSRAGPPRRRAEHMHGKIKHPGNSKSTLERWGVRGIYDENGQGSLEKDKESASALGGRRM